MRRILPRSPRNQYTLHTSLFDPLLLLQPFVGLVLSLSLSAIRSDVFFGHQTSRKPSHFTNTRRDTTILFPIVYSLSYVDRAKRRRRKPIFPVQLYETKAYLQYNVSVDLMRKHI